MPPLAPRPVVYEINTAIWLRELTAREGRPVTFATVPDRDWDALAALGIDAVWFMGVWERSPEGRRVALANAGLVADFIRALPDCGDDDIFASPYAVRRYRVDERFGGPEGLTRARAALAARGLSLVLDFVSNHVARDHAWVTDHPAWFIQGTEDDLAREPDAYFRHGGRVIACGRDPYFPAWSDVAQVNAFSPGLRAAVIDTLRAIADQADGVRCDMTMLLLTDIFGRTWGARAGPAPGDDFWPTVVSALRTEAPGFRLIAEAYWDLEGVLQGQGFDYCYDKRMYDRLLHDTPDAVYQHLLSGVTYQERLVRFVENHDEPRARAAFGRERSKAAAALMLAAPGARLLHEGQLDGRAVHVPVFLSRRPVEAKDDALREFYTRLIRDVRAPVFRHGQWSVCRRAGWPGDDRWRSLVPIAWRLEDARRLVVVNLSDARTAGRVAMPWDDVGVRSWRLNDLTGGQVYERDGSALATDGLFVDLPPWGVHWLVWETA